MAAPASVIELVERFRRNRDDYTKQSYKEANVRTEFIDPLFEALGWDVHNKQGYAEQYKEVVYEPALKIGDEVKAPDYSFRIGGVRKFFVEAKKPHVHLKKDIGPAYQLRRYAWSAKLPLSILTDFEEFAVYDTRIKPKPNDNPAVARVMYLTFEDYIDKWDEIAAIFSKEAVLKGSFDRYVQDNKSKRGTSEVDAEFLKEIEQWRDWLARNIALRNPDISVHELNFAVQRTIDRLIFLRMTEDRDIEPYGSLRETLSKPPVYKNLLKLFARADEKYNAGLFDLKTDTLTSNLVIDDKVLKDIISSLYYPNSPYEFSVLPADVLGQVYEQFLGKVIRLTPSHRAKVEEKPEVRKAGGVFYTPTYIVDYIVKETVGQLVNGKSPNELKNLRVLDPACGSGSFLLGAYQFLLDHYLHWYENHDPEKLARRKTPPIARTENGGWRLTTAEKKRILTEHIYGVDIDRQAVEVTKLSLLLKVLEGENKETLGQQRLFEERALPNLDDNIKCGNSLIGPDYYNLHPLADEEELRRVNPFDWEEEFPEVMEAGGFDAIIGNPPYIRIQTMKQWAPTEVEYYKKRYRAASKGNYDIYVVFVERALELMNKRGLMGYILPHKFFQAKYGQPLRQLLAEGRHLREIVHFGDQQVFSGATTYVCLLFLSKEPSPTFRFIKAHDLAAWRTSGKAVEGELPAEKATASEWNFVVGPGAPLFERLSKMPVKLEDVTTRIFQGLKTGADKVFIVNKIEEKNNLTKIFSTSTNKEYWIESSLLHPLVKGGDSKKYHLIISNNMIIFPYIKNKSGKVILISMNELKKDYPFVLNYLQDNKLVLEARERGRFTGEQWYRYSRNQALDVISLPKIFCPDLANQPSFSLDPFGDVFFTGGVAGGYGILIKLGFSQKYILGILNSKLIDWYIRNSSTQMRGGYFSFEARFIRNIPIRIIDFDNPDDVARHDRVVSLVQRMLDLHKKLDAASIPADKTLYQRQIEATDNQINSLVYELYGLTPEEIEIVEASNQQ